MHKQALRAELLMLITATLQVVAKKHAIASPPAVNLSHEAVFAAIAVPGCLMKAETCEAISDAL